jgi:mono/diheme cytochrome c family protein
MSLFAWRTAVTAGVWVALGWVLAGCQSPSTFEPGAERATPSAVAPRTLAVAEAALPVFEAGSAERGKQLVAELECHRCHEGTGLAAPALDQDCVRCHEQIATDKFKASPAKLAKWKPHVMPYRDVPSLSSMAGRLRPAWVMDYLLHPHDLRPNLTPTMPRLKLSPEQARDIATYLTAGTSASRTAGLVVSADAAQIARGKQLMSERGCVACHQMSGTDLAAPAKAQSAVRALGLAPDLRFARRRSEPSAIFSWLLDPTRVKHDSAMPNLGLRPEDARDLAAFVSFAALTPAPAKAPVSRLPVLARKVGFDEVNQRVFSVTCRHCHTNPDLANGDGGPGNTGGFGFKPRRIDFSSYQGIQSGGIDAAGERVSLFEKTSEGVPRLVAALVARAREEAGIVSDEVRGMPLGLPALSPEQIQLVESWVEQGRRL